MFFVFFLTPETLSPAPGDPSPPLGPQAAMVTFQGSPEDAVLHPQAAAGVGAAGKLTPRTTSQDLAVFSGT